MVFILFVKSSESPSDGDFLGSLLYVWYESPPGPRLLKLLQRSGKDDGVWGGDDTKGMVNGNEGVRSLGGREMSRSIRDGICVCVLVVVVVAVVLLVMVVLIVAMEVMGVVVVVLMVVVGIVVRVACVGVVGVVGMLSIGVLEVDCVTVVEILVLGAVFVVEVVELVARCVVGCVVRLVLWCVNERGYFLRCFSLKSVEMKGLSVGGFLLGMVIWADVLLGVMVVVEFFIFFRCGCLRDMMDVSVVMELVVGVVVLVGVMVLVWWRCSIVWQWVWETEEGVCRVVEEVLVWLMVELMVDELGGGMSIFLATWRGKKQEKQ